MYVYSKESATGTWLFAGLLEDDSAEKRVVQTREGEEVCAISNNALNISRWYKTHRSSRY